MVDGDSFEFTNPLLLFRREAHPECGHAIFVIEVSGGVGMIACMAEQALEVNLVLTAQHAAVVVPTLFLTPKQASIGRIGAPISDHLQCR